MSSASLTSRWLIAAALIASALVCCCQGKSAGRAIGHLLEGAAPSVEMHSCCAMSNDDETPAPQSPCDDRPCDCRSRVTAKSMPDAKPMIASAGAAPVAVAPSALPVSVLPVAVPTATVEPRVLGQPPTSLLRLHCALII